MTDPRIEPSVADAEQLIRKMDACTGIGAKLILLRDFLAAALQSAVAEEREECAKECIGYGHICNNKGCHAADATAIRARGQKETA